MASKILSLVLSHWVLHCRIDQVCKTFFVHQLLTLHTSVKQFQRFPEINISLSFGKKLSIISAHYRKNNWISILQTINISNFLYVNGRHFLRETNSVDKVMIKIIDSLIDVTDIHDHVNSNHVKVDFSVLCDQNDIISHTSVEFTKRWI